MTEKVVCQICGMPLDEPSEFCIGNHPQLSKNNESQNINQQVTTGPQNGQNVTVAGDDVNNTPIAQPIVNRGPSKFSVALKNFKTKIRSFFARYKLQSIIAGSTVLVLIIGLVVFNLVYDFTNLSWDKSLAGVDINYTEPTTFDLKVIALDRDNRTIENIKFKANGGEIKSEGLKVTWTLPEKVGTYEITATAPSGKKITKSINVVKLTDKDLGGLLPKEDSKDPSLDSDKDGLINSEEKKLKTDPLNSDTDSDGIGDWHEINVTETDPLKADTDGDGLSDGDEMDLELDPLKSDSKGDGAKDSERKLTYTINDVKSGVSLEITGKGNIARSTVDISSNQAFNSRSGVINKVYDFYTSGSLEKALVNIKYDPNDLLAQGLSEDNLTLYYFNSETKKLEPQKTTVNKINKTLTVSLSHFSQYVVGDSSKVDVNYKTQVMFVIDNSLSMYSDSQLNSKFKNPAGTTYDFVNNNDPTFKRVTLSVGLVDKLTGDYEFGVGQFAGVYDNKTDITSDKKVVKSSLDSIKNDIDSNTSGTNIVSALENGIDKFDASNSYGHYVILLTDGKDDNGDLSYIADSIISKAKENKTKICVIGLGSDVFNAGLVKIAKDTGCGYYSASSDKTLDEIYSVLGVSIGYGLVDTDGDNVVDGKVIADSGFIVTRDGFPFNNFGSNKSPDGNCYGMATFTMLNYTNKLPLSLQKTADKVYGPLHITSMPGADGYDLSDTYFYEDRNPTRNNLYSYQIKDKALSTYFSEPQPIDYRDSIDKNGTALINKTYYNLFNNIGMTFSVKDAPNPNKSFKKYQSVLLNISSDSYKNNVDNDDKQLLAAIYRLFILQLSDDNSSFDTDPDETYLSLTDNLNKGIPVVMTINSNHAINAVRLIKDLKDPNKMKIEVYDNNYSGKVRYISVSRSKFSKWQFNYTAWVNEYDYKFEYDGEIATAVDLRFQEVK